MELTPCRYRRQKRRQYIILTGEAARLCRENQTLGQNRSLKAVLRFLQIPGQQSPVQAAKLPLPRSGRKHRTECINRHRNAWYRKTRQHYRNIPQYYRPRPMYGFLCMEITSAAANRLRMYRSLFSLLKTAQQIYCL